MFVAGADNQCQFFLIIKMSNDKMSKFKAKLKANFEYKLSEEAAIDQIAGLINYYEIDTELLPAKQSDGIDAVLDNLVKSVRLGRLEINFEDDIRCIQTLRNGEEIVYREIDGKSKTAMGTKRESDANGRVYAVMGALSDVGEAGLLKLKGQDVGLVESLGAVFLLV